MSTRNRWGVLVTPPKQTRVALPDTGPLISMALGESLDLLLRVLRGVRLVLTHVVGLKATPRANDLPRAQAIRASLPDKWGGDTDLAASAVMVATASKVSTASTASTLSHRLLDSLTSDRAGSPALKGRTRPHRADDCVAMPTLIIEGLGTVMGGADLA